MGNMNCSLLVVSAVGHWKGKQPAFLTWQTPDATQHLVQMPVGQEISFARSTQRTSRHLHRIGRCLGENLPGRLPREWLRP
jgi:hypothetical protein